jgi:hypothetical protein
MKDVTSAILITQNKDKIEPLLPKLLSENDFLVQSSDFNDSFGRGKRIELSLV